MINALLNATDITVTTEAFVANAGNLDIAIFSRAANAVMIVENKTVSLLGNHQLTKYRLALCAADPRGDRQLASVLLRPTSLADVAGSLRAVLSDAPSLLEMALDRLNQLTHGPVGPQPN